MEHHGTCVYLSVQDIGKPVNPSDNTLSKSRPRLASIKGFLRRKSDPSLASEVASEEEAHPLPLTPDTPSDYGRRSWKVWKLKRTDSKDTITSSVEQEHQQSLSSNDEERPTRSTHLDLTTMPDGLPTLNLPSPMGSPYTPVTPSDFMDLDRTSQFFGDTTMNKSINMSTTSLLSNQTSTSSSKHVPLMQAHQTIIRSSIDEPRNSTVQFANNSNNKRKSTMRRHSNISTTTASSNSNGNGGNNNSHPVSLDYSIMPGISIVPSPMKYFLPEAMDVKTKTKKLTKKEKEFFKLLRDTDKTVKMSLSSQRLNLVDSFLEKISGNANQFWIMRMMMMNKMRNERQSFMSRETSETRYFCCLTNDQSVSSSFTDDTKQHHHEPPMTPVYSVDDFGSIQLNDRYLASANEQTMDMSSSTTSLIDSYIHVSADSPHVQA
ncbi:hypothetical protein BDF22DRAFT_759031 [Syncephalis plumigaleata]|nr:hypothetical protein BDF22DRAFT_759031 [Syncephalis plumigaleata]